MAVASLLTVMKAKVVAADCKGQAMLGFINAATGSRRFCQCISFSKKPFEAEFIWHKLVGGVDTADTCPNDLETVKADVCSEIELALELARENANWDILHFSLSLAQMAKSEAPAMKAMKAKNGKESHEGHEGRQKGPVSGNAQSRCPTSNCKFQLISNRADSQKNRTNAFTAHTIVIGC